MKATILGQWEMNLPYVPRHVEDRKPWFLDWVLKSPKQSGDHLRCGYLTLWSLRDLWAKGEFWTVREFFGGMGAQALMVEEIFDPEVHVVTDISPEAVDHLDRVLPRKVSVYQQDAYSPWAGSSEREELVVLDFGDLTAFKAQPGKPQGDLLGRVFRREPSAVVITDIAARYLHLQRRSYEPILGQGTCGSYEDYLLALGDYLAERHGYVLYQANYTHWSAVMAFVPADALPNRFRRPVLRKLGPSLPDPKVPEDFPGLVLS